MSDLISRQAVLKHIEKIRQSMLMMDDTHRANIVITGMHLCEEAVRDQPPAHPDNQINLCDSCDYSYPDCPSKNGDVIFGNNIGNDNICACNKYKLSAQSDVHDRNVGEWDMFDLITSAYYGKTMYSKQDNGIVYSRYSCKYMSADEAIREFLAVIGEDRE